MAQICPYCQSKQFGRYGKFLSSIKTNTNYLRSSLIYGSNTQRVIIVNCIVFALELLFILIFEPRNIISGLINGPSSQILLTLGAASSFGLSQGSLEGIFTANFLHGGLIHLGFNMMILSFIGAIIEKITSPWFFLFTFMISGPLSMFLSISFGSSVITVGASGAIYGLLGCGMVTKYYLGFGKRDPLVVMFFQIALVGLLFGLLPGIDNVAHIAGLLAGAGCGYFYTKTYNFNYEKIYRLISLLLIGITVFGFVKSLIIFIPQLFKLRF